jgi:sodium/bile acid cotransporter 7
MELYTFLPFPPPYHYYIILIVLAGLGLKTEEFSKALQRLRFNLFVQCFNFGVVSAVVFGVSRGLSDVNAISQGLADGMVVCASLPLTVNMVLLLTKAAGGDECSAIFNAAFGNMVGVFLSPVLILGYLGVNGNVGLWEIFYKLALRVVVPVVVGQVLQKWCPPVVAFNKKYKKRFNLAQQLAQVFIVYTVFCVTFEQEAQVPLGDIFIMIGVQFCLLCGLMVLAWYSLKLCFPNEPTLRVMGLYGCTHKTVSIISGWHQEEMHAMYATQDDAFFALHTSLMLIYVFLFYRCCFCCRSHWGYRSLAPFTKKIPWSGCIPCRC